MEDGTDRVVDLETGDIYIWDYSQGMYVKQESEPEVVTEYVAVETDSNDDQLSDLETSVSDLEVQVNDLEDEIELLSAYDAASDYNLGTTNVTIFQGLVAKVPFGQNYVYWRDGQSSYKFAYGTLSWDGSEFTGEGSVTICSYYTDGSNYNSIYNWGVSYDNSFSLDPGDRLVYSDLGDYPGLAEREVLTYGAVTAYTVVCVAIFLLLDRLRSSCFGRRA